MAEPPVNSGAPQETLSRAVPRGHAEGGRLAGGGHPGAHRRLLTGEQFVGVEQPVAGVVVPAGGLDVDGGRLHGRPHLRHRLRRVQRAVPGEDTRDVRGGHRGTAHPLIAAGIGGRRGQHRRARRGDEVGRAAVAEAGGDAGFVRGRHREDAGRAARVGGGVAVEPVVAGRGDDDDVVGDGVLHCGVVRGVGVAAQAHVDDRGALVDGVDDGVGDVGRPAGTVGAQHADREDLRGAHAGDADAVAGDRTDRARDVGPVAVRVDAAVAARGHGVRVADEVDPEVAADTTGEVGMAGLDAAVDDRDQFAGPGGDPAGHEVEVQVVVAPLLGQARVDRGRVDGGVHRDADDAGLAAQFGRRPCHRGRRHLDGHHVRALLVDDDRGHGHLAVGRRLGGHRGGRDVDGHGVAGRARGCAVGGRSLGMRRPGDGDGAEHDHGRRGADEAAQAEQGRGRAGHACSSGTDGNTALHRSGMGCSGGALTRWSDPGPLGRDGAPRRAPTERGVRMMRLARVVTACDGSTTTLRARLPLIPGPHA